ncbi:hypothetical protein GCM10009742_40590 [Kribbella karoonensis]|uniref:Uncharacterized protein n=1 Tax=Kribbella karoonensis TaxID=324851 RepID=A0ABN2DZZ7_9ACTN
MPDPDGPITAVNVPGANFIEIPLSAVTAFPPRPYTRRTSCRTTEYPVPSTASCVRFLMASTLRSNGVPAEGAGPPDGVGETPPCYERSNARSPSV